MSAQQSKQSVARGGSRIAVDAGMRNKTQQANAKTASTSSSDAREQRSRKADVGEAAEQRGQSTVTNKTAGRDQKSSGAAKAGSARGRVTK